MLNMPLLDNPMPYLSLCFGFLPLWLPPKPTPLLRKSPSHEGTLPNDQPRAHTPNHLFYWACMPCATIHLP